MQALTLSAPAVAPDASRSGGEVLEGGRKGLELPFFSGLSLCVCVSVVWVCACLLRPFTPSGWVKDYCCWRCWCWC